jgi:hypothetical protein
MITKLKPIEAIIIFRCYLVNLTSKENIATSDVIIDLVYNELDSCDICKMYKEACSSQMH